MNLNPSIERLPSNPGILFMGTPEFAVPSLESLFHHGYDIVGVVTQPDRPKGRGKKTASSPVKRFALEKGLEILQPEKASDPGFCDIIRAGRPDLIIVVAFGQILRKRLLEIPRWGVINIHASLLPAYRGAAPIPWVILNRERKTGLTLMRMDEGLDTGPILFQEEIAIGEEETTGRLHDRLAAMSGEFLIRGLSQMKQYPLEPQAQDGTSATYAPKIERELCLIDWQRSPAEVSALIRGLDPKPGAFTFFKGNEIKMFSARVDDGNRPHAVPGRVVRSREGLTVETKGGAVGIGEVQLAGKKRISAADFLRGFSLPEGAVLGEMSA
ncbi:MAG: methionyl-tRNA formyltransferase [Desulfobacteraceae bacterium]|nr:MAG: methionyl-tRNA formyltransferase [Desulfobacteraceae bacterium]